MSATTKSLELARQHREAATDRTLSMRLETAEKRYSRLVLVVAALSIAFAWHYARSSVPGSIDHQIQPQQLQLLDEAGNPRAMLRMFSGVPVLQLVDAEGTPRLTMGLRLDDSPFIDLSDKSGETRATISMTEHGEPRLRLQDRQGRSTFSIN